MQTLPTIKQIYDKDIANLNAEFGTSISKAKKVALRAFAAMHAAGLWLFYKLVAKLQKNIWIDTAEPVSKGGTLERFGFTFLRRYPSNPVAGEYTLQVTGSIGGIVPAQNTWKSDDTSESPGHLFIIDAAYALVSSSDTITVRALDPGPVAKLAVGDTLSSTKPLVNVNKVAEVAAITVQPVSAESIEDYREAALDAVRLENNTGSPGSYRIWANDVQGVKRVYPYKKAGENSAMNIFIEANPADSTDGYGTPPALMITDVYNAIEMNPDISIPADEANRRPATVKVYTLPVTPLPIDIEINGFAGVTAVQQALILSSLTNAINAIRPFVGGADRVSTKNDIIDTNKVNAFIIVAVPGAGYASVVLKVNGVNVPTYTFLQGEIPYLNSVAYL